MIEPSFLTAFSTIGLALLGGVVWLIRLEGKVNGDSLVAKTRHDETLRAINRIDGKVEDLTDFLLRERGIQPPRKS